MGKSVAIIGTRGYPSYYGGFETAVRKLAPYLRQDGWDVSVYSRKNAVRQDDLQRDVAVQQIFTRGLEKKSVSTLSYGLTAALDARRRKPDVALVMNVANGFFLPLLKRAAIPTLINVDGIEWDREKWGRFAKATFRGGARATAKHGTELVFDSYEIQRRWKQDFGRDGVFIPYGGDVPDRLPVPEGLTHRGYVLVVARFVPENTIPEFLEAAREISTRWPVVIVGSSGYGGPLEDQIRELATSSPAVLWPGHVNDDRYLFALMQHAGAYFHGHSVGGTNPALVQAMASGAPIVARDTVYNREVLGEGGSFARPEPRAIATAIEAMISNPRAQEASIDNSSRRREGVYTWEAVCEAYNQSLHGLLAHKLTLRP
ncbi:glycosyltransferase [Herbiconiux sp. UC225_62]|uniref:glycosyltransferase n=1 Tax=Herbiconiux sp. UC225_62 TaxID=3350168 RepID=UPI0036D2A743